MGYIRQASLADHLGRYQVQVEGRMYEDTQARIDSDYESGRIWTPTEERTFRNRNQVATSYQIIRPLINLVCGIEATGRSDAKIEARTPQMQGASEARTKLSKYVSVVTKFDRKFSRAFRETIIEGRSFVSVSFERNPSKPGIANHYVPRANVYVDPAALEPDLEDAYDLTEVKWLRPENVVALAPKFKRDILASSGIPISPGSSIGWDHSSDMSNMNNGDPPIFFGGQTGYDLNNYGQQPSNGDHYYDRKRGLIKVMNRWYRTYVTKSYVMYKDGRIFYVTDENAHELAENIIDGNAFMPESFRFCQMRVALFTQDILLGDSDSPYAFDGFPHTPLNAYLDENKRPCGIVRAARDPAKEYNTRRTSMLRKGVQTQYFYEQGAFIDDAKAKTELLGGEAFIKMAPNGFNKIREVDKQTALEVDSQLMEQAKQGVSTCTGIIPELLGYSSRTVSGVAVDQLQRQGELGLYTLFDMRNDSLLDHFNKIQALIPDAFSREQDIRITDKSSGLGFVRINQKTENGVINDVTQMGYDTTLSLDKQRNTNAAAQLEALNVFLNNCDPMIKMAFTADMARLANLPNAEETIPKLEKITDTMIARVLGQGSPAAVPPGAEVAPPPEAPEASGPGPQPGLLG